MITHSGFKKVPGFDHYWCSIFGDVYTTAKTRLKKLKDSSDKDGYLKVYLYAADRIHYLKVHQVVARTFIGETPIGMVVNHKDGNRVNNYFENLEYCTPADNERHARKYLGKRLLGEKASRSKINTGVVLRIRALYASGSLQREIAKDVGLSQAQVGRILRGVNWSHI